jgi:hypothetical protein
MEDELCLFVMEELERYLGYNHVPAAALHLVAEDGQES